MNKKIYPKWIKDEKYNRNPDRQETPVYERFINPKVPEWEIMSEDELNQSALDSFYEYTSDPSAFDHFKKQTKQEKVNDLWENARLAMHDIPTREIEPTKKDILEALWDYHVLLSKTGGLKHSRMCSAICHLMLFLEDYELTNKEKD